MLHSRRSFPNPNGRTAATESNVNEHQLKKEALKAPTLGQSPKVVKVTIKRVPRAGIEGVAYVPFKSQSESAKVERDRSNAASLGFDPTETGGSGFLLLKNVSRVRPLTFVEGMGALGYTYCDVRVSQRFSGNGKLTASLDLTFRQEPGEKLPAAVCAFLELAYLDQLQVHANPTADGLRIDSIVCVLGDPPKDTSVETGDPGQLLAFDGTAYTVTDLQPKDEHLSNDEFVKQAFDEMAGSLTDEGPLLEVPLLTREDRAERRMEEPNPYYTGDDHVGTNLGDKMRAAFGGTATQAEPSGHKSCGCKTADGDVECTTCGGNCQI